ncbi:spore germination protein GerPE [Halobacillus sp. Marseille-Q1614]|uniref:spore germination protein GerPE n=1 Tax=Halobacillus sp. Marseille-Q1614 TaxID=2709134 RepID=UPI00157147A9|nr:spore germination protein GerPE [Halobacillus sp. Marseille-Q1614]
MLNRRLAEVGHVKVTSLTISSGFYIGDTTRLRANSRALAVQEETQFLSEKFEFNDFPLFKRTLPPGKPPILINSRFVDHHPAIHVDHVDVKGISTAATFQIGSLQTIAGSSRVKHVRILRQER